MSGLGVGEFLAIVTLAGSLLGSLDKGIAVYKRYRNVSDNLQGLRNVVCRLSRALDALVACGEQTLRDITASCPEDLVEIEQIVIRCIQYISEHEASSGLRNARLGFGSEGEITRFKDEINRIYSSNILPLWNQLLFIRWVWNMIPI
jgi:hypothetical protein